jgi:chromosome segregation ATPase
MKSKGLPACDDSAGILRFREAEGGLQEYLHLLERLDCRLADERLRLFEQAELLAKIQDNFEKEHAARVQELESRFQALTEKEDWLENRVSILRQQQSEALQARLSFESRQARLTLQATNWIGERERLLAQIQSLQHRADRLQAILADLPGNGKDQGEESRIIHEHREAFAEAKYAGLRQELECLRGQGAAYEQQVVDLNAEVERLVNFLLEGNESDSLPVAKAA